MGLGHPKILTVGVMIFFSISGYLITESWQWNPKLVAFFVKRALRIFPALIVCVSVTACIIGAAATNLSLRDYFSHPAFPLYFRNIALLISYFLPGVFEDNIYKNAVNGSLWTFRLSSSATSPWRRCRWAPVA